MDQKKHSTLNNFVLIKTLGSGFNSKVKLGMNTQDGKYYAIKIIRDTNHVDSNIKAVLNEAKILQQLDHPNIIKLFDVSDEGIYTKPDGRQKKVLYAVLQVAPGGEIFEFLANTGKFSEPVARYYFRQIIEALDHCHSKGFAHRDMKPENLLLDEHFNILLADFGFATMLSGKDGTGKLRSILGTECYMAPEIHSQAPYVGTSIDLFATGIILFIFMTGHPPFNQAKATDLYYNLICMNNHPKFWAAHSRRKPEGFFTEEFINLMNAMLAFDPTQRPSLSEIKAHSWYNGPTATHDEIVQEFGLRKEKVEALLARQKEIAARKAAMANQGKGNNAFNPVQVFRDLQIEQGGMESFAEVTEMTNKCSEISDLPVLQRNDATELELPVMNDYVSFTNKYFYSISEAKELCELAILAASTITK